MSRADRMTSPTIIYDSERSYFAARPHPAPSTPARRRSRHLDYGTNPTRRDSLLPPDVHAILEAKRRRTCGSLCGLRTRGVRVALMCVAVLMSAVQANGVYCWPTYGPIVQQRLGLSTTEAQTIVVGGILGVYLCAAPMGALVDRHGPRAGSLMSALVAATGYCSFAAIVQLDEGEGAAPGTYLLLTASFFLVGAATVGSYFAALTTASLSFPSHPTLSLSLPLACMGLSSLFLSSFSSIPVFQVGGELDPVRYLTFLGLLSAAVNLFAAVFMRVIPPDPPVLHDDVDTDSEDGWDHAYNDYADLSASLHLDERSPLLIGGPEAAREDVEAQELGKASRWTALGLLRNPGFWAFGAVMTGCIGPSETVMATFGNIVTALLPPEALFGLSALRQAAAQTLHLFDPAALTFKATDQALSLRNKHVFILSISSTLSRLVTGVLADHLAPAAVAVPAPHSDDPDAPTHYFVQKKPVIMHRSMFAAICAALLALVFAWAAAWLAAEPALWVLSFGVGALYGALFTLSPAIVSTHFGATSFGLSWGMISYFPALGSAIFSYLYAFLASPDRSTKQSVVDATVCYGRGCFNASFWVAAGGCAASAIGLAYIGRRWKV
ncbi:MFS general substrate transporter [Cutaneotrichosporon oleaginosum]|uniref:MFS general substrate transporter n=1 Tax=Cutaneotrichosporon oleaginosum TaxID=879819 RepID=A0A0J0XKV3_9TREE|nr:MFS general substrate transporter [Cutaneotrichosporon oleaginosum]KLT41697.1 MFS general substrate transporter [Cutaneotrichosporon oleaginosum]TXT08069.1 hypothetical protein COLE_04993 [Cutaneotrichosporon oleaginosum]